MQWIESIGKDPALISGLQFSRSPQHDVRNTMATTGLDGPYKLTSARIDEIVTKTSAGTYALDATDESAFHVSRVGRSDNDLNARLKNYIGGKYKYFKFGYSPSAKAAFEKECRLYHDFNPPDNVIHPDRPNGANWKCPVAECLD
jgi:hypothetical protein